MPATKIQRTEWLELGVNLFSEEGIQGINVELMADRLECNKSSFYWHFKSKENFVNELIEHWFDFNVKAINTEIDEEEDAKDRFVKFLELMFRDKSRKDFLFYLRKWGESNSELNLLLEKLSDQRRVYMSYLIQDLGYSEDDSRVKAEILLNFHYGWHETHNNNPIDDGAINHAINLVKGFIKF